MMAWPRDETKFEMQAGPVGTSRGGDEAQNDQDIVDMLDFLLWRVRAAWPIAKFVNCFILTLLLLVILLFPLWFDITAFGYFVLSIVIWSYLFPVITSIVIELNMLLLLSVICCSLWVILPRLACRMYFAMNMSYVLCNGLSKTPKIEVLCTFIRTPFFR